MPYSSKADAEQAFKQILASLDDGDTDEAENLINAVCGQGGKWETRTETSIEWLESEIEDDEDTEWPLIQQKVTLVLSGHELLTWSRSFGVEQTVASHIPGIGSWELIRVDEEENRYLEDTLANCGFEIEYPDTISPRKIVESDDDSGP